MQPGQVSVWVPIAVALLAGVFGIVGVITGQLLNARRERLREDLRWQRERESQREQNAHDLAKHWTEARLTLLSEALHLLHEWRELLIPLADDHFHRRHLHEAEDALRQISELRTQLYPLLIRVPLVASPKLADMIAAVDDHFGAWTSVVTRRSDVPMMREPIDTLDEGFEEMLRLMKADLGLDLERAARTVAP
ncbi:hypothetical protein [Lentzea sp. CA-135723]|uniref:hypothetical protein n=1 Tax=Lentzea sp. CA-135723 TaxID=3239950 RepID=UPI003D8ED624